MPEISTNRRAAPKGRRGNALLELTLLAPWVLFLFIGILDWGFYSCALISLQSAARTAALYMSTSSATAADSATACTLVLGEMASLPNVGATCTTNPVVAAAAIVGSDLANATRVTVTYTSVPLIPIPGLLAKQFTVTRIVKMRVRS